VHVTHEHRDPQALAGSLPRQEFAPALRQMSALIVMLRALMREGKLAPKNTVCLPYFSRSVSTLS